MDISNSKSKTDLEIQMEDIEINHEDQKKSKEDNHYDLDVDIVHQREEKKKRDDKINFHVSDDNDKRDIRAMEVQADITEHDLNVVEKFEVPVNLKKTFIFSMILLVVGLTLIGIGFIEDVRTADPGKGITFWVLGGIILIPGGYYSYQFYRAKKAQNMDERDEIFDQIPEL
jgi:hypothetical protein